MLLTLVNITTSYAESKELKFPKTIGVFKPGDSLPVEAGCYDREGAIAITQYVGQCELCSDNLRECKATASMLIETEPWWQSKYFWLTVGVAVGFGTTLILTK